MEIVLLQILESFGVQLLSLPLCLAQCTDLHSSQSGCKQMLVAVHTQDIIASHINTHSSKVYVIPFLFCPSGSWRGLWLQAVPFQHVIRVDGEMKLNQ